MDKRIDTYRELEDLGIAVDKSASYFEERIQTHQIKSPDELVKVLKKLGELHHLQDVILRQKRLLNDILDDE